MVIRNAGPDDLSAIAAIDALSPESARWSPAAYLGYDCFVAELDGHLAGFLVSRDVGGEREILNLAVHPGFRRRGVACALVARELNSGACFLEVRESNSAARRLYAGFGFREVGVRPGYYENPAEGAIVMSFFS